MQLKNKKVLVVGAAKSGIAAAEFLVKKGAEVTLTDAKSAVQLGELVKKLAAQGVHLALEGQYPNPVQQAFYMLVVSPGVPLTVQPVVQAYQGEVPVIGELELAYRFSKAPVVAITGTNGKTTTTSLVGQIFNDAGVNTLVAGNIGLPLISKVENYGEKDVIVVEVSSFQLETTQIFRPRVAVILNITPDHLDRHGSMENYINAKAKIFNNQSPFNYTVLNYDDPYTVALARQSSGKVIFFSRRHILEEGVYIQNDNIAVTIDGITTKVIPVDKLSLPGKHNLENALAAVACAFMMDIGAKQISQTLGVFRGVHHRLETVAEINGVSYVNDSKGTNPEATINAIQAFDSPIILIAGGLNKDSDFTKLAKTIKEKVHLLILLGKHGDQIQRAVQEQGFESFIKVPDYLEAVKTAYQTAKSGDVVLLSPACASWDMFKSYEERGDLFRKLVLEIRSQK